MPSIYDYGNSTKDSFLDGSVSDGSGDRDERCRLFNGSYSSSDLSSGTRGNNNIGNIEGTDIDFGDDVDMEYVYSDDYVGEKERSSNGKKDISSQHESEKRRWQELFSE